MYESVLNSAALRQISEHRRGKDAEKDVSLWAGCWRLAGAEGGVCWGNPRGSALQLGSQTQQQSSSRPTAATETSPKPGGPRHGLILPRDALVHGITPCCPQILGGQRHGLILPRDALVHGITPCCPQIRPCTSPALLCDEQSCEAAPGEVGGAPRPPPPASLPHASWGSLGSSKEK